MKQLTLPNGEEIYYLDKLTALYVYNEIYEENEYLDYGIEIKDGDTVLDVGANIGLFTRYVASKASDLTIHAFEPVPPIFEVLKGNAEQLGKKVKLHNVGLGHKEHEIEFNYYPKVSADSAAVPFIWDLKVQQYYDNYKEIVCKDIPIARLVPKFLRKRVINAFLKRMYDPEKVTCKIQRLSDIIADEGIEQIDMMKIDAENYEKQVLAGIDEKDWDKIKQISMEVHEHIEGGENLVEEITKLFESKGFLVKLKENDPRTKMGVFMMYATK